MNHSKTIGKYTGSLKELSRDIVSLDYDALVELFTALKKDFGKDAINDKELKHPQLAEFLNNISDDIKQTLERNMQPMADLSRSYNEKGIR